MRDNALEIIETKLAFLERANTELSDVVFNQQRVIDALGVQVATLGAQMRASQSDEAPRTPEDERPPHY